MTGRRPPMQAGERDAVHGRPAEPPSVQAGEAMLPMGGRHSSSPVPAEPGYRGPTVCRLVDITYRQLDYWARTGLVTPSVRAAEGSGSQRLYSFTDVVELRIIKRLLNAGVSLQRIREAITYLRQEFKGRFSDVTLMCDGPKRVYVCHSPNEIVDIFQKGQGVFGIAVGAVWADTAGDVAHLPDDQQEHEHEPEHERAAGDRAAGDTGDTGEPGDPPRARQRA